MINYRAKTKRPVQNPYLVQKVMSASKEELISYIYDAAITACAQKDSVKARTAVNALIQSLNFDYKETANTFLNVYRYLMNLIDQKKFDEARAMFSELKKTWGKAFNLM
ncbi:MAG TPA: flagellar protein FliS [Caldithrix abyssi]|uniref:Flagellar protein FliS n=1 Tax=Caldithrix abyssi TaxID=187145 RepID=A0A7V5H2K4_CALAY|nr:flagellar protein FliS [Caldisericaceae bacterium]HHE54681.1 flagellar protein FliS [Caldithrix abyssi]